MILFKISKATEGRFEEFVLGGDIVGVFEFVSAGDFLEGFGGERGFGFLNEGVGVGEDGLGTHGELFGRDGGVDGGGYDEGFFLGLQVGTGYFAEL